MSSEILKPFSSGPLAIVGGTSLRNTLFCQTSNFKKIEVETKVGIVCLYERDDRQLYFVQRHGSDPKREYSPAHMVNYPGIAAALRSKGVNRVVSFTSVGSLNGQTIRVDDIVIIDDYFCPFKIESYFCPSSRLEPDPFKEAEAAVQYQCHIVPSLTTVFREEVVRLVKSILPSLPHHGKQRQLVDHAVYANALGPRFETKAEIRFFSQYADVIGMTSSWEANAMQEQHIEMVAICMVDNLAHGVPDPIVGEQKLDLGQFLSTVESNAACMEEMGRAVLEAFVPKLSLDEISQDKIIN